jgi:AMIN domain
LRHVTVTSENRGVLIDVELTAPVKPSVLATTDPFRLVLDFGNTIPAGQRRVGVNVKGVRAVRYALYQSSPPVTRVVVDLDQLHSYELRSEGNRVTLIVTSPVAPEVTRRHIPASAASEGLLGIFRPHGPSPQVPSADESLKRPYPPPVASSAPTAAHPDRGSLQEGTVFPGLGSPGTGNVPGAAGSVTASSTTPVATVKADGAAEASPAKVSTSVPATALNASNSITSSSAPVPDAAQTAISKNDSQPSAVVSPVSPPPSESSRAADQNATKGRSTQPEQPSAVVPSDSAGASSQTASASVPEVPNPVPPLNPRVPAAAQTVISKNDSLPAVVVSPDNPGASEGSRAANQEATAAASTPQAQPPDVAPSSSDTTESMPSLPALDPNLKTVFKVKYVAEGAAYLDGGRSSGLTEGMKLEVKESDLPMQQGSTASASDPRVMAELEVVAVTETSAVTDIHAPKRPVKQGDLAYLSTGEAQALIQQRTLSATRKYPMVVAFTEDDPQDEEARAEVPRPPQPSVNRTRGWIGLDHMGTVSHGSSPMTSSELGLVLRADITRIGGSYWNLTGYWRGRLSSSSSSTQPTLQDLINRTYHLGLIYDNPNSRWVAGVGRLYLPWAPSLDTIDGGYFGMRLGRGATAGFFAGSTPDPTSWNYNPDRRIGGSFINFQGGSYDRFYYSSTSGLGVSTLKWQIDRPFVFFENSVSYKRLVSIYDSLQADNPRGNQAVPAPGPGLSRNFLTVRLQVHPRLELDLNHNYFRDIPTFDPALIGTGLLDKYLFQGFSVGARAEIVKQVFLYADVGRSNRTGDTKNSWNQMAGISFNHLPWFGLRSDAHYSRFNSSFGDGSYKSFSVSREVTDTLLLSILAGTQNYSSTLASNNNSRFLNGNAEWSFGTHYFMQGGFTINRGGSLSYDQWLFTLGYRFDSKAKHK